MSTSTLRTKQARLQEALSEYRMAHIEWKMRGSAAEYAKRGVAALKVAQLLDEVVSAGTAVPTAATKVA